MQLAHTCVLLLSCVTRFRVQTDDICADFEKRLKAIAPSANGGAATGRGPAGSAQAACAVAQAQTGSLILAATGACWQRG